MGSPTFSFVESVGAAADRINLPHEDYPKRVPVTEIFIREVMSFRTELPMLVNNFLVRSIHVEVMWDLPERYRGNWRDCMVQVGDHIPPSPLWIESMMGNLHPRFIRDMNSLQSWYISFEDIHPFIDGNGRVGGIVLAAFSYRMTGKYCIADWS